MSLVGNLMITMSIKEWRRKVQEVYHDGSEGEVKQFNSLKEMLPELEKSLNKKDVKFIKVSRLPELGKLESEEVNKTIQESFKELIDNEKEA